MILESNSSSSYFNLSHTHNSRSSFITQTPTRHRKKFAQFRVTNRTLNLGGHNKPQLARVTDLRGLSKARSATKVPRHRGATWARVESVEFWAKATVALLPNCTFSANKEPETAICVHDPEKNLCFCSFLWICMIWPTEGNCGSQGNWINSRHGFVWMPKSQSRRLVPYAGGNNFGVALHRATYVTALGHK